MPNEKELKRTLLQMCRIELNETDVEILSNEEKAWYYNTERKQSVLELTNLLDNLFKIEDLSIEKNKILSSLLKQTEKLIEDILGGNKWI